VNAAGDAGETARLARVLLQRAQAVLRLLPRPEHGGALAAPSMAGFLASPGPSTFVAAMGDLAQQRRRFLLRRAALVTPGRTRAAGVAALRRVRGLPAGVADRLAADLPEDRRARQRLLALEALVRVYEELAGRVAAETEDMRQRFRDAAAFKSRRRKQAALASPAPPGARKSRRRRPPGGPGPS
jgi:hypothetical protein